MSLPSKFTNFNNSILCKMLVVLEKKFKTIGLLELYHEIESNFSNIDEYIYSIDVLYVLGYIEVDIDKGDITYVKRNSLR